MKKIIAIGCTTLLLFSLFTGCEKAVDSSSASLTASNNSASTDSASSESQKSERSIQQLDAAPEITWETQMISKDDISYEIPSTWSAVPEMEQPGIAFYTLSDANLSLQPSNIVVETGNQTSDEMGAMDYSDTEIQQSFFDFVQQSVLDQKDGLSNEQFSVWKNNDIFVYIVEYDRAVAEGYTAHQTCFYPMGLPKTVIVYATDFGDDIAPDVTEAAKAVVSSLAVS